MEDFSLTNLSIAGGCGCKQQEDVLSIILQATKQNSYDPAIVIGFENSDDCAVYNMNEEEYLLLTTDFFTPVVDDPNIYGMVAAANALSDVYAMGGTPFIANTILGYPKEKVPVDMMQSIIKGGTKTLDESSCIIVGGHTIENPQPFYGFTILGRVNKKNLKRNDGAQKGDVLILTKPLGTGIYSNAIKLGLLPNELYESMVPIITKVNTEGAALGTLNAVHGMTDLTGFGLVGHVLEMCGTNKLEAHIAINSVELFPEVTNLANAVVSPGSGVMKNFHNYKNRVINSQELDTSALLPFYDPQSNGGLLIAVAPDEVSSVLKIAGPWGKVIGFFTDSSSQKPRLHFKQENY